MLVVVVMEVVVEVVEEVSEEEAEEKRRRMEEGRMHAILSMSGADLCSRAVREESSEEEEGVARLDARVV